jgi:predicted metalloprotease with PDZ domain|tara:strand:+ start:110 stop:544 length:435 start_codon:yes stop_codon:yes gene_type:complete
MSDYKIDGVVGDTFIKITHEGEVEIIFGETENTISDEISWEGQQYYKTAVQFALMIDSHIRNSHALDDLITNSTTGSIPYELLNNPLIPLRVSCGGIEDYDNFEAMLAEEELEDPEEEKIPMGLQKKEIDNVIQFKPRKNNEDK